MSTLFTNIFSINGVVDTSKNVMENINNIASSASAWVTFDIHTGKWSVIVNEPIFSSTQSTRTAKSITTYNQAGISTVQKKFGTSSIRFDGNGDYMRVSGGTAGDFQFGTDSFTIEFWVYRLPGATNEAFIDMRTAESQPLPCIAATGTNLYYYVSGQNKILATNALPNVNTWYHIALSKSGTNTRLFVNGTQVGQFVDTTEYVNNPMNFGKLYNNTQYLNGYIDEIRVSKGVARYTSDFTVASQAFVNDNDTVLLIHAEGTIIDDTLQTVTGASFSFDDRNIIGGISVSGTGLTDFYNKVQLTFPHQDLNDRTDTITYEIPTEERYDYEPDNTLNVKYDLITNPIQAEYLAAMQLKQNRVDQVINFRTDFSGLGVKAGDIIEVTNDQYSFNKKLFRVLSVAEEDTDDYNVVVSITAFEYQSNVYDASNLVRTERTTVNSISSSCTNTAISDSDQAANEVSIMKLLIPLAASSALNSLWNMMFPNISKKMAESLNTPAIDVAISSTDICENSGTVITISVCSGGCCDFEGVKVPYEITGVSASDIDVPLKGEITVNSSGVGTLTITSVSDGQQEGTETLVFKAGKTTKEVKIHDFKSWSASANPSVIQEGQNTTVTFTTSGIPNGTIVGYTISGNGVEQLSGTAAQGQVTINNNSATLQIATKSLAKSQNATLNVSLDGFYCSSSPASITLSYAGPAPVPTTNCEWVTVPTAWCGTFDDSGVVRSVFPVGTIQVLAAISGQPSATVPLTATVTNGNISVASTVAIDTSSSTGGIMAKVLTGFNAPTVGVKRITGPSITVQGR